MPEFVFGFKSSRPRDALGRFTKDPYKELIDANRARAEQLHAQVIREVLTMPLMRPNVRTGRLLKAISDSANRGSSAFGFGVLNVDFMDRSLAKYWRTIEEGSAATWKRGGMAGMKIYGQWGGSISGYYTNRWGLQPRAAGPWREMAFNGKLRGMKKSTAKRLGMKPMIVHTEIQPHHYLQNAWEKFEREGMVREDVVQILRRQFGLVGL